MWILPLLGYLGILLGFGFLTLAIASGLYYLSEVVEEHSVLAKKLLTRMIYAVIAMQVLLLIDRLPLLPSLLSIGSHMVYLQNLRRFPVVKLTDPIFLLSCGQYTQFTVLVSFRLTLARRPCCRQPLLLVPPLLKSTQAKDRLQLLQHLRTRLTNVHGDRFVLRPASLAGSLLSVRVFVGRRECPTKYGIGVRHGIR